MMFPETMMPAKNNTQPLDKNFEDQALVHLDDLYSAALRLTRNPIAAEDLVQESILRAWKNWERFQLGTNCRAWLLRIQVNTFINGYRRTRTERGFIDGKSAGTLADGAHLRANNEHWTNPERAHEHRNMSSTVKNALAKLKPEFRTVVVLSDLKDLSYKEIADIIDCPIGTVMSRLFRARRSLRDLLTDHARSQGLAAA